MVLHRGEDEQRRSGEQRGREDDESPPGRRPTAHLRQAADHHIQHVYTKIGVSTRGAAALYAIGQGILTADR